MSDPSYSFHFLIFHLFAPSLSYFPVTFFPFLTHFFPSFTPSRFPLTTFPSFFSSPSSCVHLNLLFPFLIFTLYSIPLFSAPHSLLPKNSTHSLLSDQYPSFPSFKPPHFLHTPFPSSLLPPSLPLPFIPPLCSLISSPAG